MERKLPQYQVEGTAFYVDVQKEQMREVANPANTISFNSMRYMGTHYRFSYDPLTRNIPEQGRAGLPEIQAVEIPLRVQLDTLGMAEKYHRRLEEIAEKTDYEVIVNQDLVRERLSGQLPEIQLASHRFTVDLDRGGLYFVNDPDAEGISFRELEVYERHGMYQFPYNTATGSIEHLDYDHIRSKPQDVVFMEIPIESKLDPVLYASHHRFERMSFLMEHNIELKMKGRPMSWKEVVLDLLNATTQKYKADKKNKLLNPGSKRGKNRGR